MSELATQHLRAAGIVVFIPGVALAVLAIVLGTTGHHSEGTVSDLTGLALPLLGLGSLAIIAHYLRQDQPR